MEQLFTRLLVRHCSLPHTCISCAFNIVLHTEYYLLLCVTCGIASSLRRCWSAGLASSSVFTCLPQHVTAVSWWGPSCLIRWRERGPARGITGWQRERTSGRGRNNDCAEKQIGRGLWRSLKISAASTWRQSLYALLSMWAVGRESCASVCGAASVSGSCFPGPLGGISERAFDTNKLWDKLAYPSTPTVTIK